MAGFGRKYSASMGCRYSANQGWFCARSRSRRTAKLWSPKSGLAEQTIASDEPLNAVVFHPNPAKTLLATGGARGAVRLFDWSKGAVAREWRFGSAVYALAFDPNGQMLACGGELSDDNRKHRGKMPQHQPHIVPFSISVAGGLRYVVQGAQFPIMTGRTVRLPLMAPKCQVSCQFCAVNQRIERPVAHERHIRRSFGDDVVQ